jgi:hypothetical protein
MKAGVISQHKLTQPIFFAGHSLFWLNAKCVMGYNYESLVYAASITQWSIYDRCPGYTVLAHSNKLFLKTYLNKEE